MKNTQALMQITETLNEVSSFIEHGLPSVRKRLKAFLRAFNRDFQNTQDRGAAESLVWALLEGPVTLYALKLNGPALVELHAVLERFAMRDLSEYIAKSRRKAVFNALVGRAGLVDLATTYVELGVWNKRDQKFCVDLNRIRNGVAHKNPCTISNRIRSGRAIHIVDIDYVMAEVDIIPHIRTSIHLLVKLANAKSTIFEWTSLATS